MKVFGIVAEYDPFHNGHKYQIDYAKNQLGADAVAVVMSGDFTQRGEPAVVEKYKRARMAVLGGADLVIMMPAAYSTSSAEFFAMSGISLLENTHVVTDLIFGAETDDLEALKEAARNVSEENPAFKERLEQNLSSGLSFAKARALALNADTSEMIDKPNNILAVEYLKSLHKIHSEMIPHVLLRKDASYDGRVTSEKYASASFIRNCINQQPSRKMLQDYMPAYAADLLSDRILQKEYLTIDDTYQWFVHKTIYEKAHGIPFTDYADLSADLACRIEHMHAIGFENRMEGLVSAVKAKNFTRTYITRAICHFLLDIRPQDRQLPAPYIRVLDFSETGRALIKEMKIRSALPVFTNVNEGLKLLAPDSAALAMLQKDLYTSDLYSAFLCEKTGRRYPSEREKIFTPACNMH